MLKYLIFLLLLILFFRTIAQNVVFYKENITFQLDEEQFLVSGDYYFRNLSLKEVSQQIYYPIYSDSLNDEFDTLLIFNYKLNQKIIPSKQTGSAVTFNIQIPADDSLKVNIFYRQIHTGNYVKYILTTTKSWGIPLEVANYYLITDKNMKVDFFSYPPQDSIEFDNKTIYEWKMKNFMPDQDFEIRYD